MTLHGGDTQPGEVTAGGAGDATTTSSPGADVSDPPGVTAALSRLEDLQDRPVGEHVEVFDEVHRLLQDALATLDEA